MSASRGLETSPAEPPPGAAGLTDYHAKYFAHELTKRCPSDSLEKLAGTVAGAQVDLNPHQVDAALFAFRSPLSKGALLADEVGLGKTIEAGLVIAQRWAERKRCILVITPANLRKQWHQELSEKFFLPCQILETRSYNEAVKNGHFQPFQPSDRVVICSYQFARGKATDVHNTPWDLVVMGTGSSARNSTPRCWPRRSASSRASSTRRAIRSTGGTATRRNATSSTSRPRT
jgi:adenine-specific DNA-methyltransferase